MDSTTLQHALNLLLSGAAVVLFMAAVAVTANTLARDLLAAWFQHQDAEEGQGPLHRALRRWGDACTPFMPASYEAKSRKRLIQAGEPRGLRPEDLLVLQLLTGFAGALLGVAFCLALPVSWSWCVFFTLLGLLYPQLWLRDRLQQRRHEILRALPYNLDLLTLSVEAGLDFAAALGKVVERGKPGPFREELQLVLKQLKVGKTREEALRSMVARVDLPSLTLFVTALIQADRMGTSLAKILRSQANQLRSDRTQRAEKLANQAPVKMLFPLIACIFPTVFLILFGPIVFSLLFGGGR